MGIPNYGDVLSVLVLVIGMGPFLYYSLKKPTILRRNLDYNKDPVYWGLAIGVLILIYRVLDYYL